MAASVSPQQPPLTQDASLQRNVFVRILEEPASKALRFRYECEGRSAGSLPGANSTQDKKSFPKIQVVGYRGRAVVVVSCVTIDPPYRAHPHNLVGKEGCKKGVCTMEIANEDMTCEFSNLGIQCVKKKDIEDSLKVREEIRVDPFRTGFLHKSQPGSIDLNSVRLCFQVFCEGPERGQFKVPLKPVVSEPIYDKKAINDLTIMKMSDCNSPVMGNKEIILLCDKVSKDDIEIRFYEENEETGSVVWESFGDFQPSDVHKQYAICFRTPQYHNLEITSPARVFIQLRCPSKDTTSAPRPFQYIPLLTSGTCKRKWNLVSFSGAYSGYMTTNTTTSPPAEEPTKKLKSLELEDILAGANDAIASATLDAPIYDRLNEFRLNSVSGGEGVGGEVENVYDVDLELISQIIKTQEEGAGGEEFGLSGGDLFTDIVMADVVNGNGGDRMIGGGDVQKHEDVAVAQQVVEVEVPTPPTRPPKSPKAPAPAPPSSAPPLPPKKTPATTPTKSPSKSSPATFFKNLFSPTKKNKQDKKNANNANINVATQQQNLVTSTTPPNPPPTAPLPSDNVSTTTSENTLIGNYELTEQLGLYVDNDAPLATANKELKRKRVENNRHLSQYFEANKRPRQNSYPPVNSPTSPHPPPQNIQQVQSPPPQQQQQPQQLYQQPVQLQLPPLHQVYIKQEPNYMQPPPLQPNQYYYDMMTLRPQQPLQDQQTPIQFQGGGIIQPSQSPQQQQQQQPERDEDPQLNSDFSLPHLSDVNLSLLDQHLSENLNDMNLNNF